MLDSLFEFLFKYRPAAFDRGALALDASGPVALLLIIATALLLPLLLGWRTPFARASRTERWVIAGLRLAAVALIALALLRPVLVVTTAVPQQNVLAVLIDDSRSMAIADVDGVTRRNAVIARLAGGERALLSELDDRFVVRTFRFARSTERLDDLRQLTANGRRTLLATSLDDVKRELAGVPLAGIVVVSDGGDNAAESASLEAEIGALVAARTPVFTVGVGAEQLQRDIELRELAAPRHALAGASVAISASLTQRGYAGERVDVIAEDNGRIVASTTVTLAGDGEVLPVRLQLPAGEAGIRRLRIRVAPRDRELITENNERRATIAVRDTRTRILYVEGEPRFEFKFLRRALAADPIIQLVALQRTAEGKFLRLGVEDSTELANGFPATREDLFAYSGVIIGSIEASFFTLEQMRMLADFVARRGGGLLMLGGRRSFAEGGYAGTPLAEALPVELGGAPGDAPQPQFSELRVSLTRVGASHAATQLAPDEERSAARWRTLPPVTSVNGVDRLKPGATMLLAGRPEGGRERPVLAYQRYGRGLALALTVQDSWLWQMHADIPLEDLTHETLWQQLLRWLVSEAEGPVTAEAASTVADLEQPITISARVQDKAYLPLNDADVTLTVTTPSGASTTRPMPWTVSADGEYAATFTPTEPGVHTVQVGGRRGSSELPPGTASLEAADMHEELFDAGLRAPVLRRIADQTGGRYYPLADVSALPRDVVYTESGSTSVERLDLWDMPILFLMILALVLGEWLLRRRRGFA